MMRVDLRFSIDDWTAIAIARVRLEISELLLLDDESWDFQPCHVNAK